jgi:serine/threonine protein phosphatase PrpC
MIAFEQQAAVLWMGDSRLYRLRKQQFEQLTVDHSRVQDLVNIGAIESAEAEDHPMANIITRAVGAKEQMQIESTFFDIQPDDSFLLCSDGLYREVTEIDLGVQLRHKNCQESCAEMIEMALQNECRDNVTALVINAIACDETVLSV